MKKTNFTKAAAAGFAMMALAACSPTTEDNLMDVNNMPEGGAMMEGDTTKPTEGGAMMEGDTTKPTEGGAEMEGDTTKPTEGGAEMEVK